MTEDTQRLERLIVASRNKFRALVDGIDDGVMSIDDEYRVVAANSSLAEELGIHPKDLIGQHCYQVIYGSESPCREHYRACPAAEAWESDHVEVADHEIPNAADGEDPRIVEVRAMPVPDQPGGILEMILVRRDVTVQRQAERHMREHNEILESEVQARTRELVSANDELIRLQQLKDDLTSMVVHDLKGPLSEIQANLEMLQMQELEELSAEFVDAAKMGGDDLLRMITNLLDISRMEEDRMVLAPEPIDVRDALREITERATPLARLKEISLTTDLPEEIPLLTADKRLFERILGNLISNALDHTPEGGSVTIGAAPADGGMRLEVVDTGRGVPAEYQETIFAKFSQGQKGSSKSSAGLGLTFCKMAVEAHGGTIHVEPGSGGLGSKFIFELPLTINSGADEEAEDG